MLTLVSVASCADSSSELRPPSSKPLPAGCFPRRSVVYLSSATGWEDCLCENAPSQATDADGRDRSMASPPAAIAAREPLPAAGTIRRGSKEFRSSSDGKRPQSRNREYNPEHRIGNPNPRACDGASSRRTNPRPTLRPRIAVETTALDADAPTEPVAEAVPVEAAPAATSKLAPEVARRPANAAAETAAPPQPAHKPMPLPPLNRKRTPTTVESAWTISPPHWKPSSASRPRKPLPSRPMATRSSPAR